MIFSFFIISEWKHGLFNCICPDCACAYFCGPCYIFDLAQKAGKETCSAILHACFPPLLCCLRCEIREKHGLKVLLFYIDLNFDSNFIFELKRDQLPLMFYRCGVRKKILI
jgi:hypothetical protein